jgi:hypothetical protein
MNRPRCGDSWAWISALLPRGRNDHLLEKHQLGEEMLETVNHHLASKGIQIATGTIVDATIIHAPSSTKNASGERDPEMHQTRKGNQWYFGLKAHIGVDSKQGVVHSVCTSAASVADCHMLPGLSGCARSAPSATSRIPDRERRSSTSDSCACRSCASGQNASAEDAICSLAQRHTELRSAPASCSNARCHAAPATHS